MGMKRDLGSSTATAAPTFKSRQLETPHINVTLEKTVSALSTELTEQLGIPVVVIDVLKKIIDEHAYNGFYGSERHNEFEIEDEFNERYADQDFKLCILKAPSITTGQNKDFTFPYATVGVVYKEI